MTYEYKRRTVKIENNLKKYREKAGYTQSEVAKYLNISTRQYQRLEGATPKIIGQWYDLAKLLSTTLDSLLK